MLKTRWHQIHIRSFIVVLIIVSNTFAGVFLNSFIQKSFNTHGKAFNYSFGYCFKPDRSPYSYYEIGLIGMPSFDNRLLINNEQTIFKKTYTKSFYGTYGAGYFFLFPIFRPGIILGGGIAQKEIWKGSSRTDLKPSEIIDNAFVPYYGLSAHIGMLSVVFSNLGYGLGINIQFNKGAL
jgi:hypothetical protein